MQGGSAAVMGLFAAVSVAATEAVASVAELFGDGCEADSALTRSMR